MDSEAVLAPVLTFLGGNYDVFYETLKTMTADLMLTWSSVNRSLRKHCQNEMRRRFNVCIRNHIDDIPACSRIMLMSRTVISGSAVLPVIDPSNDAWKSGIKDLDFYTCHKFSGILLDYLRDREGYVVVEEKRRVSETEASGDHYINEFGGNTIHSVYVLRRSRDDRRIDVVVANSSYCSTWPIFQFDSTVVMNFLSPTLLFIAYPRYTLKKVGLINYEATEFNPGLEEYGPWNVSPNVRHRLDKYRERGFTLAFTPQAWDDKHHVNCRFGGDCTGLRRTNDGKCLIYPFGGMTVYDQQSAFFYEGALPGGHVEWSLGGTDCIIVNTENIYPAVCYPILG